MLRMDKSLSHDLDAVNRDTNQMPYKTDMELYGKLDHWNPDAAEAGDCDDYACVKRKKLRLLHPIYASSFKLATCWVEGADGTAGTGGYHAVLTVNTNKGVYVLDNRYPEVTPWRDLPYRWHKMENPGQYFWVLIQQ